MSGDSIDLNMHSLSVGVPAQLLQNRPDIRQAERELAAAGLDVKVARATLLPQVVITAGVGYQAFNPRYLFITPEALIDNVAGDLVAPLINRKAIQAEYLTANARQLQAVYNYQRVILNAFTEVSTACPRWRTTARASRSRSSSWNRSRPPSKSPPNSFSCPRNRSNTWTCSSPSVTSWTREWS